MTIIEICKTLTLVSLAVFLAAGSYFLVETTQNEKQLTAQASVVLQHTDMVVLQTGLTEAQIGQAFVSAAADISAIRAAVLPAIAQINVALATINQKCIPVAGQVEANCGTLADLNRTLMTLRGAIGTVEVAGEHFDKNEQTFYDQEAVLFTTANSAFAHFDTLVSSKDLATAINNGSKLLGHLDTGSALVDKKLNDLFYPPACKGPWCAVKNAWNVIHVGSELLEPSYYGYELLTGGH